MNMVDIVKKALQDIEKGTIDASAYTEDMILSGPVPKPLNRNEYIALMKNLVGAAPDWNFHARDFTIRGDIVKVTVNITGTQANTLPAIIPGMSALPPTNKSFGLPEEHLAIKVQGDKISQTVVEAVPGGGVMGMLSQLGAQLKNAA